MLEVEFAVWLNKNKYSKKVSSDLISRLKRLENSLKNCDLDEEYKKNSCFEILALFKNSGNNEKMESCHIGNLPLGKYQLATYKYALNKYIQFRNEYI